MPAVEQKAPLPPVAARQAEVGRVALAAFSFPLRLSLHWAFPSKVSRPMAALHMPVQSRETLYRPAPGTNSPSYVPGRVAHAHR
jgi:hypothetical protein